MDLIVALGRCIVPREIYTGAEHYIADNTLLVAHPDESASTTVSRSGLDCTRIAAIENGLLSFWKALFTSYECFVLFRGIG
jgi:hypothetical protein